jgi:ABC-2 type transport system ATP-binding protein
MIQKAAELRRTADDPVTVRNLVHNWGETSALRGVSLDVGRGKITGLIGPDGAGKSTLMKIILSLADRTAGTVACFGFDPSADRRRIRDRFGYMPETFSLYTDLTVEENLLFSFRIHGARGSFSERRDRLYRFSRLGPFSKTRAGNLSGGMKQKLALSCALMHDPELLVLDEPTTGVDPLSRREFWTMLGEIRGRGISILVSTPYMDEALLCDHVCLMHRGLILDQGVPGGLAGRIPGDLYELSAGGERPQLWREEAEALFPGRHLWLARRNLRILFETGTGPAPAVVTSRGRRLGAVRVEPELEDLFIYRTLTSGEAAL